VVLDYGVILGGYCSDMTRNSACGPSRNASNGACTRPSLDAQLAAIDVVRPGVQAGKVTWQVGKYYEKLVLTVLYPLHRTRSGIEDT